MRSIILIYAMRTTMCFPKKKKHFRKLKILPKYYADFVFYLNRIQNAALKFFLRLIFIRNFPKIVVNFTVNIKKKNFKLYFERLNSILYALKT